MTIPSVYTRMAFECGNPVQWYCLGLPAGKQSVLAWMISLLQTEGNKENTHNNLLSMCHGLTTNQVVWNIAL